MEQKTKELKGLAAHHAKQKALREERSKQIEVEKGIREQQNQLKMTETEVLETAPVTYELVDLNNESILGKFYFTTSNKNIITSLRLKVKSPTFFLFPFTYRPLILQVSYKSI